MGIATNKTMTSLMQLVNKKAKIVDKPFDLIMVSIKGSDEVVLSFHKERHVTYKDLSLTKVGSVVSIGTSCSPTSFWCEYVDGVASYASPHKERYADTKAVYTLLLDFCKLPKSGNSLRLRSIKAITPACRVA